MQLIIGQNLSNNRVKLEYTENGKRSANLPCYKIDKTLADEFVKKYNSNASNLLKLTAGLTAIGGFCGYKSVGDSKLKKIMFGSPLGAGVGVIIGALISYSKKNNLMNKYNVEKYSE